MIHLYGLSNVWDSIELSKVARVSKNLTVSQIKCAKTPTKMRECDSSPILGI